MNGLILIRLQEWYKEGSIKNVGKIGLHIISYLLTKLTGAGVLLFGFSVFMLLEVEFDMYQFVRDHMAGRYWMIFYGYGIGSSLIIDLLAFKVKSIDANLKVILYGLAGFVFFLLVPILYDTELSIFIMIAGIIGALCSLLFYFGMLVSYQNRLFKYTFALVIPVVFILIMNVDFTVQKGWTEIKSDSTYTASFEYFNGQQVIPIEVKKGQSLVCLIDIDNMGQGGHGYYVLDQHNEAVGMTELSEDKWRIDVLETGILRIFVTGEDLQGRFTVEWAISEPS